MRATQKIYRPKSTSDRDIDALKQRMQSVRDSTKFNITKVR